MTVQIKIEDQMYADYLRYLFAVDNDTLKVNSEHGMGKLLIAHCRVSRHHHQAQRQVWEILYNGQ